MLRLYKTGYTYTDKFNIKILDLTKADEAGNDAEPQLVKWARILKAKTMEELEKLAGNEEVFETMVTHIKELSEDERIRLQCQAREDYERRLLGEYNRGTREGMEAGKQIGIETGKQIGEENGILKSIRNIMQSMNCTADKAMDMLLIPIEDRASFAGKL